MQEDTSTSPPSQKATRPHTYRRYATTAAAFLLLVSSVVFGARFLPSTSPENTPLPNNTLISDSGVQARSGATPEDIPDGASLSGNIAGQVAPQPAQGLPIDNGSAAPSPSSDVPPSSTEDTAVDQPNVSTAIGLMSAPLTQEEAEKKLLAQLTEAGNGNPQLSFLRLSEDGTAYLFLYTNAQATKLFYSVSLQDGSIFLTPTEESASLTEN